MRFSKNLIAFSFCLSLSGTLLLAEPASLLQDSLQEPQHLLIQNRILARVHTKTISVLDVVKKMEVFLNKYYPQYVDSLPAKYQYFSSQWKETLSQMIDQQLILADADKMELKITDSEIRETLFEKFGPNVMTSLDKLHLSYEEAKAMIHSELAVQRMTWFKVHSKALAAVNLQDVKMAYTNYAVKNPPKENWEYQVLSIKAPSEEIAKSLAEKASLLCHESPEKMDKVSEELKVFLPPEQESSCIISVSERVKTEDKHLSVLYKGVLSSLKTGSVSEPIKQVSRAGQSIVYRIFHLISHVKTPTPSFRSMQEKLHDQLVQEAVEKESRQYIAKLRERYGFDARTLEETIPSGFQPFSLQ